MKQFTLQQQHQLKQLPNDIAIFEQHHINNESYFHDPKYFTIMLNSNKELNISYDYSDNIGDNISDKNLTYVDLTGMYWIWKNVNNITYKGNVHYKRFFSSNDEIMTSKEMLDLLKNYDALIAECARLEGRTVYQIFNDFHGGIKMDICRGVVKDIAPNYLKTFDDVIITGEYSSLYNIIIAKNNIFNAYAEWLFTILFECEDRMQNMQMLNYTENDYQRKVFGFLGERLMLVWLKYNNINYKEVPIKVI